MTDSLLHNAQTTLNDIKDSLQKKKTTQKTRLNGRGTQ